MATIDKFTLVQISSTIDDKPSVTHWSPSSWEEPEFLSGHIVLGVTMTDSEYE